MKNTQGPSLLSCFPSSFSWLHPHPASSATFIRGHTHTAMHKCTHINTKPVAHTKQVFILSDVSLLSMFLHLCVCMCVCVSARWYFLSRAGYQPQTYLPLSFHLFLFLSLTVLLFPSIYCGPWKTSTTFPPDPNPHLAKNVTSTYVAVNIQSTIVAILFLALSVQLSLHRLKRLELSLGRGVFFLYYGYFSVTLKLLCFLPLQPFTSLWL